MRSPQQKPATAVAAVDHYYAISVAFTRDHHVELRLTQFHRDPSKLTTDSLGRWEAQYVSAVDSSVWVQSALNQWVRRLTEQYRADSGQGKLFRAE